MQFSVTTSTGNQPPGRLRLLTAMPVTSVLIGICVLVFAAMVLRGVDISHPTADQLLRWGANFGPLTLDGQWWRLVTAMFLHIGLVHLALNMWCLWYLGEIAERLYGPRTFAGLYLLTGVAGSIASVAHNPVTVSAGASGAIFGVAGALIATLYLGKLPAPARALRTSLTSLLVFAGYNLAYGFIKSGIDNSAHFGGLVSGLLLGAVLSLDFRPHGHRRPHWRGLLFPFAGLLLLIAAMSVRQMQMPVLWMAQAERQIKHGDAVGGIALLQRALKARPNTPAAWSLLGLAYTRNRQDAEAEQAFTRAAQLDPSNRAARAQLGVLYLRTRRYEQARATFQQLSESDPKDAAALANLGVSLNRLGRNDEAATVLRRAITLDAKLAPAWFNLGLTFMELKQYDAAVAAFTETTHLAPDDSEAWVWLAKAYQSEGAKREAEAAFLTADRIRAGSAPGPSREPKPE